MMNFKITKNKFNLTQRSPINKTHSLIRYYGGKYFQTPKYIPYITSLALENQCHGYVEATAGGARTLLNIPTNLFNVKVYNEFDLGLCKLFQCVQEKNTVEELIKFLKQAPYNKEYFQWAKNNRNNTSYDKVTNAALTYICAMQSRSADMKNFKLGDDNIHESISDYYNYIDNIRKITPLLKNTYIISADFRDVLEKLSDKNILKFIDPPYHPITRIKSALDIYPCELSIADHKEMVGILMKSSSWILCGYDPIQYGCDDYKPLEDAGAKKISMGYFNLGSSNNENGYSSKKEEFIWIKK